MPRGNKSFSCSTQLSMKFQQRKNKRNAENSERRFLLSYCQMLNVFIMPINIKMPTIVGILTFMSRIKFMFSCCSMIKRFTIHVTLFVPDRKCTLSLSYIHCNYYSISFSIQYHNNLTYVLLTPFFLFWKTL